MAGKEEQQPIPLNLKNPNEAMKYINILLASDSVRFTGKEFVGLQHAMNTINNIIIENGKLKAELASIKMEQQSVQDTES